PENYRYKNDSSHHNYYSSAQNLGSLYTLDSYKKCDNGGYAKISKSTIGLRLETTCEAHTSLVIPDGCSYFDEIMFVQHWTQFGYYKRSDLYEARYIFPKAKITIGNETASWDGNCTGEEKKEGIRDLTWGTETFGSIRGGIGDYGYKRIKDYSGDITYELDTYPYRSGGAKWGPKKDYDYEVDNPPALFDLEMILSRRVFSNRTLGLKIYTANDEDVINGLSGTPEFSNLTAVSSDSPLYGALHPTVSINPTTGGTVDGLIYVGSMLNVTPPAGAGGYSIKLVFLTNSKGDIVSIGGAYSVKMLWQNMTEADIDDTYTINVVMGRSQTVTLNIKNSLPQDSQGNSLTDPGSISDTWSLLGSDPKATIYYTECVGPQNYLSLSNIDKLTLRFGYIGAFSGTFGGGPQYVDPIQYITEFSGLKTAQVSLKPNGTSASIYSEDYNIQGICFNQDADDTITYDGTSYDGNEIIWLKTKDFSVKELEFKFYDSSVKKYLSKMDTTIIQTQVYYDANGNGKIDGWFDRANNLFILDKDPVTKETYDRNLGFFDNKEIDEYSFAPRYNEAGQLCQYFIKVYYTMNPRCLDIPSGHSADETVRVLPAFTTSVTSEESMTNLTREQTAFRYIQAGDTRFEEKGSYSDSSAGHIMYTAAAGKLSILDIPLGGDKSPAVKAGPKQYVWTPDYEGSLMFDFDGPVPINIRKNVTLSEVSIAGESPDFSQRKEDGKVIDTYTYHSGGDAKLNGYLGSFYGNSTFAICVNEKEDLTSLADINPETVTIGTLRTLPNSDYLSLISGTDSEDTKGTTNSSGKSDMPEFEVDMGIELPSLEIGQIGLSDYLQIVMDGKSVGFTIGLPLRGYESSKVGSGASEGEGKGFHDSNETFGDVVDFISACCGKYASGLISGKDYLQNMFAESHSKAESQSGVKVKDIEVKFSVSLAIMFEYNPIDDGYYFQSAGIAASLELQAKFTYRLTVCPIIYFYLKISAAVEVSSGFSVARKAVEGSPIPIMSRANAVADYKKPISVDETESIRFTINIG
ncbi:MAG: hypothetical protein IJT56_11480, partial [Clostridia bacterium]|nr:hypothetical protein [Clostridia bacterium]